MEYCPRSKPSPYAKRWWNGELTSMRRSYTAARNRASKLDSQGRLSNVAQREAAAARVSFHREIKRAKRDHWNSFVEEPTNVWKVAKYLDTDGNGQASFSPIPNLTITDSSGTVREVSDDSAIADELLRSFFPPTAQPTGDTLLPPAQQQLPWERLQKHEIRQALWTANQDKAPGPDGLPTRVWKEVWPILEDEITRTMETSMEEARLPQLWKRRVLYLLERRAKVTTPRRRVTGRSHYFRSSVGKKQ